MTWVYSGDPNSSEKDLYRFLISDTNENEPILQDTEIEYILDEYSDKSVRLYHLFDTAATILSRDIKKSLGPQAEDPTNRLEYYRDKVKEYRTKAFASGLSLPKSTPIIFTKGMHDNV